MLTAALRISLIAVSLALAQTAAAWEMSGRKAVAVHTRDGQVIPIGTVDFSPASGRTGFALHLDHSRFRDYFLSMKEFKCLEGGDELVCHVPYPYPNPSTVTANDLVWLEHSLMFLYKRPSDYGAKLWNGLYFQMRVTDEGIVGVPQAVDLNAISAPPANPSIPPFGPTERTDFPAGSRWLERLTIR